MKARSLLVLIVGTVLCAATHAKDERLMFKLDSVMESGEVKKALALGIPVYFGKQPQLKVEASLGEVSLSRRTTVEVRTPPIACQRAFARAMEDFQERARAAGANAVINIRSNYKNNEVSSETEFMCGVGTWAAGVAFKGELVKLAK